MKKDPALLPPFERISERHDLFDAGLDCVEWPVEQIKHRLAAEIIDAGWISPDDPHPGVVPEPGRIRRPTKVFKRWYRLVQRYVPG